MTPAYIAAATVFTETRDITTLQENKVLACFCGCEEYSKNENGFHIACTKCGHGPQNHDDEFRASARKNESQSQKRDVDFG